MNPYFNKRVLIVGAGKSGLAAARFLQARGADVVLSDNRADAAGAGFPVTGQEASDSDGFDLLIQSPGVPLELPLFARARERGTRIIGELELSAEELKGQVIGITGSNGKTTTTALTGHIFRHAGLPALVGGNIGIPVTELVAESSAETYVVLELSSFQLETAERFRAHIAVVLNITPDHLDRHHTMERYVDAKARLVETQDGQGVAILNAADPYSRVLAGRTAARLQWFNLPEPAEDGVAWAGGHIWLGREKLMDAAEIPLPGRHNVENVMAAAAAAWAAGVEPAAITAGVRTFPGVEHRIEFVREIDGVRYFNDSKATNVDAAEKAIAAFPGRLWIILGGKDKNSDYRPLAKSLEGNAKGILLIGAAAPIIREQLSFAAGTLPMQDCGTLKEALRRAHSQAEPGDIVLLSPACASFDQYQSYEHRGRSFKELVHSL